MISLVCECAVNENAAEACASKCSLAGEKDTLFSAEEPRDVKTKQEYDACYSKCVAQETKEVAEEREKVSTPYCQVLLWATSKHLKAPCNKALALPSSCNCYQSQCNPVAKEGLIRHSLDQVLCQCININKSIVHTCCSCWHDTNEAFSGLRSFQFKENEEKWEKKVEETMGQKATATDAKAKSA